MRHHITTTILLLLALTSCKNTPETPTLFAETDELPLIVPDYKNITCPPNIAPLNFRITNPGEECIVQLHTTHDTLRTRADNHGMIHWDEQKWKTLLQNSRGDTLRLHFYLRNDKTWRRLRPSFIHVAQEPIDSFVTYRLIEPSYRSYRNMTLVQRNLTTFEQHTLTDNHSQTPPGQPNACINCHTPQAGNTKRTMMHIRVNNPGTLIYDNGQFTLLQFPTDSLPHGATYPAWHPRKPWIVFSSNHTGQSFHLNHDEKIEVQDITSHLFFYNHLQHTAHNILHTDTLLPTYPTWHPDGTKLYFAAANIPAADTLYQADPEAYVISHFRNLHYDIYVMPFDTVTLRFGTPKNIIPCANRNKSATLPRISPDGRYLLYTLADYGQFHIWHNTADLWMCDLHSDTLATWPLKKANAPNADSYHSWNSDGRWIIFSSRRDDGNYTRLYIAHINQEGQAEKAFMMPQQHPQNDILLLKSCNVPELSPHPTPYTPRQLRNAITHAPKQNVTYQTNQ